jgi:hypothetical protein
LKRTVRGLFQGMSPYSAGNTEERYEIFPSRKLISIPILARRWFIANKDLQPYCCTRLPFCKVSQYVTFLWFKSKRGTYCLTPVSMLFLNSVEEFWRDDGFQNIPRLKFHTFLSFNIGVEFLRD